MKVKMMAYLLLKLFEWILSTKLFRILLVQNSSLWFWKHPSRFDLTFNLCQQLWLVNWFYRPNKVDFHAIAMDFFRLLFFSMAKCWKLCNHFKEGMRKRQMYKAIVAFEVGGNHTNCVYVWVNCGSSGVIFVYVQHLRCLIVFCVLNVYRCVCLVECLFSFRFLLFWFFSRFLVVFVVIITQV